MSRELAFTKIIKFFLKFLPITFAVLYLIVNSPSRAEDIHSEERVSNAVGTTDFAAYYCAYQLYANHENPYNDIPLNELCSKLVPGGTTFRLKFMYPPMFLPALGPVLQLGFKASTAVWYISNLFFLLISGVLIWKSTDSSKKVDPFLCAISALVFPPAFECLEWGQVSIFITLMLSVFFWGVTYKKDIVAGCALALLFLKAHLFFIWIPFLIFWIFKERRVWIPVSAFILLSCLSLLSEFQVPGIHTYWLSSMSSTSVHGEISRTASVSGMIRYLVGAGKYSELFYAVPGIGFVFSLLVFLAQKNCASFHSKMFPILCLSVAFAPYAWFHDYTVLLVLQVGAVARAYHLGLSLKEVIRSVLLPWVAIQLITVVLSLSVFWSQHQLFWYPFALLLLWSLTSKNGKFFQAS